MIKIIDIALPPVEAFSDELIKARIALECGLKHKQLVGYKLLKRSVDARSLIPKIRLSIQVFIDEQVVDDFCFEPQLNNVINAQQVIIIGAGPAGLFAALKLIALGIKPIILERGKDVCSRRRDLAILNKEGIVNPDSNYCFGEGGAGTYSDGKLYTRSTKRGNVTGILELFKYFGADPNILIDSHPHIGTNKLPQIITRIRQQIIECGGEVYFEKKVTDIVLETDAISGVIINDGTLIKCKSVILATGHSARDIFSLLHNKGIEIECKPFAIGVRIEHPQIIIDQAQYHCTTKDSFLPPASYSLVSQEGGRGVFSFCMCPGGIIAASKCTVWICTFMVFAIFMIKN